jgi:hypothetical protein
MGVGPPKLPFVPHVALPTLRSAGVSTPTNTNWYSFDAVVEAGCTVIAIVVVSPGCNAPFLMTNACSTKHEDSRNAIAIAPPPINSFFIRTPFADAV